LTFYECIKVDGPVKSQSVKTTFRWLDNDVLIVI